VKSGGVAQWTSHPPQDPKTRVQIPPGYKVFREFIALLSFDSNIKLWKHVIIMQVSALCIYKHINLCTYKYIFKEWNKERSRLFQSYIMSSVYQPCLQGRFGILSF
jgi:hypothetical protein